MQTVMMLDGKIWARKLRELIQEVKQNPKYASADPTKKRIIIAGVLSGKKGNELRELYAELNKSSLALKILDPNSTIWRRFPTTAHLVDWHPSEAMLAEINAQELEVRNTEGFVYDCLTLGPYAEQEMTITMQTAMNTANEKLRNTFLLNWQRTTSQPKSTRDAPKSIKPTKARNKF